MNHIHGVQSLSELSSNLMQKDDMYFLFYVEVMSVLGKFWPRRFTSSEYLVLSFLANRTLVFRKKAEMITNRHFLEGITSGDEVVCEGAGLSDVALRKALASLSKMNYIHIHCFKTGKVESTPRIYELNYEALIAGYDLRAVKNMLKRGRRSAQTTVEKDDFYDDFTPLEFAGGGGENLGGITELLHSSISSSLTEEESAASQPSQPSVLKVSRRRTTRRAIDCNPTSELPTGGAKERLAQMQRHASTTRASRLQAVRVLPPRRWDMKELQALLDEARARAGLSVPRIMATTKGAGVLHKRMKEAEITDTLEFFTWALQNWSTVANANRRAKSRQLRESKSVQTEMSMMPNFAELAYRFPYILAFFNDRKYTAVQEQEQKEEKAREAVRIQRDQEGAIDRRRAAVRELDLARREEDKQADQRMIERRRNPRVPLDGDDDDFIPVFKEREWRGK